MRQRSRLLIVDGVVNLFLGLAVLGFPESFFRALGLPWPGHGLYSTILGGVLVGIGFALIREGRSEGIATAGLGLWGAVAINLAAGFVIAAWLLVPGAGASPGGRLLLWVLVAFLVALSAAEIVAQRAASARSG